MLESALNVKGNIHPKKKVPCKLVQKSTGIHGSQCKSNSGLQTIMLGIGRFSQASGDTTTICRNVILTFICFVLQDVAATSIAQKSSSVLLAINHGLADVAAVRSCQLQTSDSELSADDSEVLVIGYRGG